MKTRKSWLGLTDSERFERVFEDASARAELNELRRQLTAEEAPIASAYIKKLIESRTK